MRMSPTPATEELFREDADLLECDAVVTAVGDGAVQLDRTVFYPQGGGQAGDAGVLVRADGRTLAIADTRKGPEPGQILHLLADPAQAADLAPGERITTRIDAPRRQAHRRFHSATHLLCALV